MLVEVRALAESAAVLGARVGPLAGVRVPVTRRAAVAHEGFVHMYSLWDKDPRPGRTEDTTRGPHHLLLLVEA